jgi:hypothetical protein
MKTHAMNTLRFTLAASAALMLAACSSPSVRQSIERQPVVKPLPAPVPAAPKEPVVRTLPGSGLKESPLSVKPLPQIAPPPMPAAPMAPSVERAPVTELPALQPDMQAPAAAAVQLALATPAPSGGAAAKALASRADEQMRANDPMGAAASLERALRIEPNNAGLWSRLAEVRLRQGDKAQAEQLALKSNGLAGADAALRARNDRIIAQARGR